ncbi:hypothetical protein GCM10023224_16270 [Streptomonospora halophila]|uniref:Uncharacterized protein n=1 Tax=Streptomonospora halophila TaxID=427369 RepID=A0ABP9GI30_9ACTN
MILNLLGRVVSHWDLTQIAPVLNALGKPYSTLTAANRKRPKLPDTEAIRQVLSRLQQMGTVSGFSPRDGKLQVTMKSHSAAL